MDKRTIQEIVEKILFRRGLEHKLEGYTLETAIEIAEELDSIKTSISLEGYNSKGPTYF